MLLVSIGAASQSDARQTTATAKCRTKEWQGVHEASAIVVRNADGDTTRVRIGQLEYSVRMLSIDTPEKSYQQQSQGEWAYRASDRLARLLPPGTAVRLELEEEPCDAYGRILAHFWKGKTNVNLAMVREGYAVNYCIFPNIAYCARYGREAQRNADAGKGMFSDPDLEIPYVWRRIVSGRDPDMYVGDLRDYRVHPPEAVDSVPLGSRVFFFDEEDIAPPFALAP